MAEYDIAIIGGGPGGYVAAIRAAQLGKKVVAHREGARRRALPQLGLHPQQGAALERRGRRTSSATPARTASPSTTCALDMGEGHRPQPPDRRPDGEGRRVPAQQEQGHRHQRATATFESPKQLARRPASDEPIEAKNVIIATGARPRTLPGLETDGETIINSREALALREQPESVVIVGGGPIGVEFATFWRAYGVEVTIVEVLDHLLPLEDEEISVQLERAFKKQGIEFHTRRARTPKATAANGRATVTFTAKGKEQQLDADKVLIGIGFEANVEASASTRSASQVERGYVKVDDDLQTPRRRRLRHRRRHRHA